MVMVLPRNRRLQWLIANWEYASKCHMDNGALDKHNLGIYYLCAISKLLLYFFTEYLETSCMEN